jgi:DNA invertase Pin-like site-specific DNA recombinase
MAGSPKKSPAGGTWDGIYDPCRPNDRLLLNMKGSISEFAVLRARMLDAARAKARRGELRSGSEWDVQPTYRSTQPEQDEQARQRP